MVFGKEWSTEDMAAAMAKIAALGAPVRNKDADATLHNVLLNTEYCASYT